MRQAVFQMTDCQKYKFYVSYYDKRKYFVLFHCHVEVVNQYESIILSFRHFSSHFFSHLRNEKNVLFFRKKLAFTTSDGILLTQRIVIKFTFQHNILLSQSHHDQFRANTFSGSHRLAETDLAGLSRTDSGNRIHPRLQLPLSVLPQCRARTAGKDGKRSIFESG